jgi:hypothetical protein
VELPGVIDSVTQGDALELDLSIGALRNLTTGIRMSFTPPPDFILDMLEAGGIYPMLARMAAAGRLPRR